MFINSFHCYSRIIEDKQLPLSVFFFGVFYFISSAYLQEIFSENPFVYVQFTYQHLLLPTISSFNSPVTRLVRLSISHCRVSSFSISGQRIPSKTPFPGQLHSGSQLWPQQLKYITCRRDSSACVRLSSLFPTSPPRSGSPAPETGRISAESPPEENLLLPIWKGRAPDFHLHPWSAWPFTTATLVAIQTRFK